MPLQYKMKIDDQRAREQPQHKSIRLPPGPPRLPVFGNLLQLGQQPHQDVASLCDKKKRLESIADHRAGEAQTLVQDVWAWSQTERPVRLGEVLGAFSMNNVTRMLLITAQIHQAASRPTKIACIRQPSSAGSAASSGRSFFV
ncbi:hypothetical protein NC651_032006 [Populus alba x Populus x berolinensis]|nr:hypothetical protein NC651_032006 [Populus alba x Populus x berolinensis]